jgi:zinc D-Ala-D-Ala carboxypeptidase
MKLAAPGGREERAFPASVNVIASVIAVVSLIFGLLSPHANAAEARRPLKEGDRGDDVAALQVRIAGWFPEDEHKDLQENGFFGRRTTKAVTAFKRHYGLDENGIVGPEVYQVLDRLEDADGSTAHFDWVEFVQNKNTRCSDRANRYAGTFKGGPVSASVVKANLKRLMWRLEAVRAKAGDEPIGINSGFRSIPYNRCIGGASLSQHLYGTAADLRIARTNNRHARDIARRSQFGGIGCYSRYSHNHFDLRLENDDLAAARYWWWPKQDGRGRDLADDGKPCYGETSSPRVAARAGRSVLTAGAYVPGVLEIERFKATGETLNWGD